MLTGFIFLKAVGVLLKTQWRYLCVSRQRYLTCICLFQPAAPEASPGSPGASQRAAGLHAQGTGRPVCFYLLTLSISPRLLSFFSAKFTFKSLRCAHVCVSYTGQLGEACPQKPEQHEHRAWSASGSHGN